MRKISFVLVSLWVLASCQNNDTNKKEEKPATDSTITVNSSSVEKQFDSATSEVKPVRDSSILFKFNFQKGKVYDYVINFDMKAEKEKMSRSNSMKWNYSMQLVDEKNSIKTIKTTYKRIEMSMDPGTGQKMEFTSEQGTEQASFFGLPSKMLAALKGKSFTMQVNTKGEILSISGLDKIGEAMVNAVDLPAEMKQKMMAAFKDQFSEKAVKQMFSQSFSIFPNKAIKVGDSWQTKDSVSAPVNMETTTIYTVKNIKNNFIYLSSSSKIKGEGSTTGTETGKLIVDSRSGLVTNASFEQKLKGVALFTTKSTIRGKELNQ